MSVPPLYNWETTLITGSETVQLGVRNPWKIVRLSELIKDGKAKVVEAGDYHYFSRVNSANGERIYFVQLFFNLEDEYLPLGDVVFTTPNNIDTVALVDGFSPNVLVCLIKHNSDYCTIINADQFVEVGVAQNYSVNFPYPNEQAPTAITFWSVPQGTNPNSTLNPLGAKNCVAIGSIIKFPAGSLNVGAYVAPKRNLLKELTNFNNTPLESSVNLKYFSTNTGPFPTNVDSPPWSPTIKYLSRTNSYSNFNIFFDDPNRAAGLVGFDTTKDIPATLPFQVWDVVPKADPTTSYTIAIIILIILIIGGLAATTTLSILYANQKKTK